MNKQVMLEYFGWVMKTPFSWSVKFDPILGWIMVNEQSNYGCSISRKFALYIIDYYARNFPSVNHYFN